MQRLILMRHGDAERQSAGLGDFERGLTGEGKAETRLIGRALADAGLAPDLALVSAARRTQETWKALVEFFPQAQAEADRTLYAASAVRLAAAARDAAPRAGVLIIVGHNPGIHQYAVHLAIQAAAADGAAESLFERFPTGSAAVFGFDAEARPSFERVFMVRDYRSRDR